LAFRMAVLLASVLRINCMREPKHAEAKF